jgi:hypothetical protein
VEWGGHGSASAEIYVPTTNNSMYLSPLAGLLDPNLLSPNFPSAPLSIKDFVSDANGNLQYEDLSASNFPRRFYGFRFLDFVDRFPDRGAKSIT